MNTTRALRADQSKEEEFANIAESAKLTLNNYSYHCALSPGYYVFTVYL